MHEFSVSLLDKTLWFNDRNLLGNLTANVLVLLAVSTILLGLIFKALVTLYQTFACFNDLREKSLTKNIEEGKMLMRNSSFFSLNDFHTYLWKILFLELNLFCHL